jgi:hypothetical protein
VEKACKHPSGLSLCSNHLPAPPCGSPSATPAGNIHPVSAAPNCRQLNASSQLICNIAATPCCPHRAPAGTCQSPASQVAFASLQSLAPAFIGGEKTSIPPPPTTLGRTLDDCCDTMLAHLAHLRARYRKSAPLFLTGMYLLAQDTYAELGRCHLPNKRRSTGCDGVITAFKASMDRKVCNTPSRQVHGQSSLLEGSVRSATFKGLMMIRQTDGRSCKQSLHFVCCNGAPGDRAHFMHSMRRRANCPMRIVQRFKDNASWLQICCKCH